jgi:hypothetical protein
MTQAKQSVQMRLTERATEQIFQWLESVVRDFENHNKEIWLQRIEQTAENTADGDDIIFEVRAIEAIDRAPQTIKILRNCFQR